MSLQKTTKTVYSLITATLLLFGCTATDRARMGEVLTSNDPEHVIKEYVKDKKREYQQSPESLGRDIASLRQLLARLKGSATVVWGEGNVQLPGNKKYVKYTNDYQSMALVDFEKGLITVETIASKMPKEQLKKAIVTTLLTSDNPANTDIFSDESPTLSGKPYLLNQVLDHDKKSIEFAWRAKRFADHLIKYQLKKRNVGTRIGQYVEISMVSSHNDLRKEQYAQFVLASANRYQVRPDLIYAIIETESSFNPFAVSSANAYGLMQIVPTTAGKDVYQKVYKKAGIPTKQVLFTPQQNIDIGAAYLHILQDNYLRKVSHPQSRHYSIISAYNGGAGNVLKTFSSSRDRAMTIINSLTPAKVYDKLTNQHPSRQSRRYLQKVLKAQSKY